MAASALTTATAAALTSTLPDSERSKSAQQSPRHTGNASTVAVRAGAVEVSKALQEGEKFIKWDEVSSLRPERLRQNLPLHITSRFDFAFLSFPPLGQKRRGKKLSIERWVNKSYLCTNGTKASFHMPSSKGCINASAFSKSVIIEVVVADVGESRGKRSFSDSSR
jgi:hypothetical protein